MASAGPAVRLPHCFLASALVFSGTFAASAETKGEATKDAAPSTAATPAIAAPPVVVATAIATAPAPVTAPPAPAASPDAAAPSKKQTAAKATATDTPAAKSTATAATLQRIRGGTHIEVHARDLRLADTAKDRLFRIAERFFKATGRKLIITGGSRTPQRQAELMIAKIKKGEDIAKLYENRAAAIEIRNLYQQGKAKKLSSKALVDSLKQCIETQMAAGNYVSKHLKAGAADVRSRDMKPAEEKALRAAVAAEPGVSLVDERQSAEPHFHLGL